MRHVLKFFKTVATVLGSLMLLGATIDGAQKIRDKRRNATAQS